MEVQMNMVSAYEGNSNESFPLHPRRKSSGRISVFRLCRMVLLLCSGILAIQAVQAQTMDTLPTFRLFCQNSMVLDSIKTYTYQTSLYISQDTVITHDLWIGQDSVLFIKTGITVRFDSGSSLIVNGGILQIGKPTHSGYGGAWTLRAQNDTCMCGIGPNLDVYSGNGYVTWGGIHIKAHSTAYIYGANFFWARNPIKVEGDPSPSNNWCGDPPPLVGNDEFVWVECCTFRYGGGLSYPSAAIYLHGRQASHVFLNRLSIYAGEGYQWANGIIVEGDSTYGPVRGAYLTSINVQDAHDYGIQIRQPGIAATCTVSDITTWTEVVMAGIRIRSAETDGLKIYGAVRARFTECEGGLEITDTGKYSIAIDGSKQHYNYGITPLASLFFNTHTTRVWLLSTTTGRVERHIWAERGAQVIDSSFNSSLWFHLPHDSNDLYKRQIHADSNSHVVFSYDSTSSGVHPHRRWFLEGNDSLTIGNRLFADTTSSISVLGGWWAMADTTHLFHSTYLLTDKIGSAANIINSSRDSLYHYNDTTRIWSENLLWFCNEKDPPVNEHYKSRSSEVLEHAVPPHTLNIFPNPALQGSGSLGMPVTIGLTLMDAGAVEIAIYSIMGERVKTLVNSEWLSKGVHFFRWMGDSGTGTRAASGVYCAVVRTTQGVVSKSLLLSK